MTTSTWLQSPTYHEEFYLIINILFFTGYFFIVYLFIYIYYLICLIALDNI